MDYIEKAVRKAKDAQQFRGVGRLGPALEGPVQYTHTKVQPADQEILQTNRILSLDAPENWAEPYKILRTQVLHTMEERNWKTLAVTSPGESEGKSVTAANLAVSIAMEFNRTVLLIDANLRRPSLHQLFGIPGERGLRDYLLSQAKLADLLVNPGIPDLVLLPAGKKAANSSELLRSPLMKRLVDEVKHRYPERMIIFDLPEVLAKADTAAFAPYIDATLLVVEAGKTTKRAIQRAFDYLSDTPNLGVVLNKAQN